QLFGMDATVRWKPLRRAIYRSFVGRTELVWGRARQIASTNKSFGYFVSGDYQFGRRWFIGGRFDRSGRLAEADLLDTGGSIVLTYRPSEFSQVRVLVVRAFALEPLQLYTTLTQVERLAAAHATIQFERVCHLCDRASLLPRRHKMLQVHTLISIGMVSICRMNTVTFFP
ncbi:MAG: porin family protein, partial [Anaerolineales bacterium]|nr:porin family protein [Anaerolineales bacterium]